MKDMGDEVQITVIATGIDKDHYRKVVKLRDLTPEEAKDNWTVKLNGEEMDEYEVPAFQRRVAGGEKAVGQQEEEACCCPEKGNF